MKIPIFQVDAFHDQLFKGNPAAVCPLGRWLADDIMQAIAMENNLSETAFFVQEGPLFSIRWFTPKREVDLCGHATLASAHVIINHLDYSDDSVEFNSKSGRLLVSRDDRELLKMNFPSYKPVPLPAADSYSSAMGEAPESVYKGNYLQLVYRNADMIMSIKPDFKQVGLLDPTGVIITAPGKEYDFISRFFAPTVGIDEDPVTGSAHSTLIPYWAERLQKKELTAFQASKRGGVLYCENLEGRVIIAGRVVTFLQGTFYL